MQQYCADRLALPRRLCRSNIVNRLAECGTRKYPTGSSGFLPVWSHSFGTAPIEKVAPGLPLTERGRSLRIC